LFGEEKPEDVIGKLSLTYFSKDYPLRRSSEMIPALLREGYWHAEQTVLPRHGKPISTLESAFLIRDDNGNPFRIAVVISDITEWKRAEAALRREKQTLRHLLQSSDHERQLIAYEIHDGLAQQLAGALMQFEVFAHLKDTQAEQAADAFRAGVVMLRQGHFEARRLIAGVRPPILDESGVVEGIAHLVHEQGRGTRQKIDFRSRVDFDRLVPSLENSIYRIAQEGLTNACQHSQSGKVQVSLLQHGDTVRIEIRDWGVGFDAKAACKNRFGLEGIRQRARLLGGKCSIRSAPGKGTRIAVELPVVLREP
jgi:signal transduction histidine kinase